MMNKEKIHKRLSLFLDEETEDIQETLFFKKVITALLIVAIIGKTLDNVF